MARVLLLATTTGYQIRAFGEAAERLGVDLVFGSDRCHMLDDPWMDRAVPIRFHDRTLGKSKISSFEIVKAAYTVARLAVRRVSDRRRTHPPR